MLPVSHAKYAFLAVIAASATLSSSVFAQRPKNPPPDDCPNDNPECKCPTDDAVENGCVLVSLDLGRTTPWTGSDSVKLKIRTTKASPSLSTPSQLKLVLGYSFMYVGSDLTAAGAPRFVFFAQSAGRTLSFQFADGSSVGIPSPGMYGESKTRLQMVDAEGWATLSNPAYYDLYPGDGSVYRFSASPAAPDFGNLVHRIDPRGVLSTWEDMGVTVLRDAAGNIRQVSTRTRLADVQTLSDTHYTVTVYPLDAEPETDPDTGLLVLPQWDPTRVLDVSQGSSPLELLVGFQKGTGDMRQYRYVEQNGEWTLVKPSGLVDSKEIFYSANETGARRLHLIRSPEGELLRRTEMNFASTPWGWAMTNRIEGIPGDATRTTSWSFYEEGPNRGEIREKITPTGNRILYEYDDKNRVVRESMPLVEEETLYSYEPVDPSDPSLLCDTRPRCVVRKMQGIEIQRTYYVYGTNGIDVVERVGEQGAAYGGTNVLRTVTTYYPVTGAVTDGLVQSVRHEDGTVDDYAYDLADGVWTEFVTHVHEQAPAIVPMRTTRSVRVYNALGRLVDLRTDLCTIGVEDLVPQADWTPIERLQYAYDVDGNEIRREDLAGRLWTAEWAGNCCGKVSETDWQGITTTYAYDENGRVSVKSTMQPTPIETCYEYNSLGDLVAVFLTNRIEGVGLPPIRNTYDSLGRVIGSCDALGNWTQITYSDNGRTVIQRNPNGSATERRFDFIGKLCYSAAAGSPDTTVSRGVSSDGTRWTRQTKGKSHDKSRYVELTLNMLGQETKRSRSGYGGALLTAMISYDTSGRISDVIETERPHALITYDNSGTRTTLLKNQSGQVRKHEISNQFVVVDGTLWRRITKRKIAHTGQVHSSLYEWRVNGGGERPISESIRVDESGVTNRTRIVYDVSTSSLTACNTFGDRTSTQVSRFGRPFFQVDKNSVTNEVFYDPLGRVAGGKTSNGDTFSITYGSSGLIEHTSDGSSRFVDYSYDWLGRVSSISGACQTLISFGYDEADRIVSVSGSTYPTRWDFDEFGNRISMTTFISSESDSGNTTKWFFDAASGLVTGKEYPDGSLIQYDYTPAGKLFSRVSARGIVTTIHYDDWGNEVLRTYSDGTPSRHQEWDGFDRLVTAVVGGSITNTFQRSNTGRVTREESSSGWLTRTFLGNGRIGQALWSGGENMMFGYDSNDRLESIELPDVRFVYEYDPTLQIPSRMVSSLGFSSERRYDRLGQISAISNCWNGQELISSEYAYDELGRCVSRLTIANGESTASLFEYDDRSELISYSNGTFRTKFQYDLSGNRLVETNSVSGRILYSVNMLNQTTNISSTAFQRPEFDEDGNLTRTRTGWVLSWDAENRIKEASNGTDRILFFYDYCGRIVREVELSDNSVLNEKVRLWDGFNIIQETTTGTNGTSLVNFYWGLDKNGVMQGLGGIGGLLSLARDGQHRIPAYDAFGNIVSLVSEVGTFSQLSTFDPFGNRIFGEKTKSAPDFSTKFFDERLGAYEYQFRWYDPVTGKWLSRDPLAENSSENLYCYVRNRVPGTSDILGLISSDALKWCGPDVTSGVEGTIMDIGMTFESESVETQKKACLSVFDASNSDVIDAWDILPLAYIGLAKNTDEILETITTWFPGGKIGQGDGCADTVVYNGKCYHAGDVNYLMFGKIMSLCHAYFPGDTLSKEITEALSLENVVNRIADSVTLNEEEKQRLSSLLKKKEVWYKAMLGAFASDPYNPNYIQMIVLAWKHFFYGHGEADSMMSLFEYLRTANSMAADFAKSAAFPEFKFRDNSDLMDCCVNPDNRTDVAKFEWYWPPITSSGGGSK